MTYIGSDFGNARKWVEGDMTGSGIIYCPPDISGDRRGILKIDTNTDTAT